LDGLARRATGGQHSEPMELTPDWCGSTKEWAQDITLIDDPVGLAVLWHSCRCSVMLSSHRGDAGGRRPTRGWCERRVLVQGIVALGESSSHSGPQREGEPRGVACAGFRDRLRERGFGRGERWRLLSGGCVAPPCSLGVHPPLRPRGADRGSWACPNRRSRDGGWWAEAYRASGQHRIAIKSGGLRCRRCQRRAAAPARVVV
jgi:hypothetical protein